MEIIDELEKNSRKIYAGGIGYFSANGDFDTCIALRTAITKNNKFYVQAGAGIVADSKPINEYNETINKAKALIKFLGKFFSIPVFLDIILLVFPCINCK